MIGIPVALAWSIAGEWWIHKHVLHAQGKHRESFWSFHWHEHHRNVRRTRHRDPSHERPLFRFFGTREPYQGTEREAQDTTKRERLEARRKGKAEARESKVG